MQAVQEEGMRQTPEIVELARDHYEIVFRFCARRVGVDEAGDLAQNTFLTAQKALGKYHGMASITTWLLGIAHNECRRHWRTSKTQPAVFGLPDSHDGWDSGERSPESEIVDRQSLQTAFSRLSPEHREVVILHEIDGLNYEEAAHILNVPVGTVKSRLHHAFQNLRKYLHGYEVLS